MADIKDRITVVSTVYLQPAGEKPASVESRFDRELETQEQFYTRRLKATEEWQLIDPGWLGVDGIGMMVIANDEGKNLQTIPTDEEKADTATRVLEICFLYPTKMENFPFACQWLTLPGESMQAYPSTLTGLHIRCRKDTAKFTVSLFPR